MKNNQPSCTRGNPPTESDIGKIWVYWDEDTPDYIRADNRKEAWVEMLPRLSPRRWAEILKDRGISIEDILQVCWEDNILCEESICGCVFGDRTACIHWRPDSWMEEK